MYTAFVCVFPLILLLFEWGLRTIMSVNTFEFTGPALAAAGVSFLPPLVRPKIINVKIRNRPDVIAVSKADHILTSIVWMTLLLFLFAWCAACYVSIKFPQSAHLWINDHLLIGIVVYASCLAFVFVKEKV
ncbi:hypothetical protein W911_16845 [Hyphomicrobium nitrativorans NL23]|uniref:Uncharacterized protein n=1 Tax=Hyphomicrobium nitrativorans NL23 TaxID=1029756 RepID=V5SHV4_9HYPH|nr:hypothetical protein [Hyphomicrobium nitrativorans]AHB50441.1 hypothetical protein W911_16845 [Hyphomicrobium nitrativorans NL23]